MQVTGQTFPHWMNSLALLVGGGGIGAVVSALIQKPWTKQEKGEIEARIGQAEASGDAEVVTAVTHAFVDITGGLRDEIKRLQGDAVVMRERAVQFESELRAALQRVDDLERAVAEKDEIIARQAADLERVRGERDLAQSRVVQQEGEIRQLNALLEGRKRIES